MHNALFGDNSLVDPYTGASKGCAELLRVGRVRTADSITEVSPKSYGQCRVNSAC